MCYYVKMIVVMMQMITVYLYLYELSQRITIINSSYSLSATEKHSYFRSEDISIWRKKVKLFMFYSFRVTVYIFMADVTSCVQTFSPCRRVFVTGRKSVRGIHAVTPRHICTSLPQENTANCGKRTAIFSVSDPIYVLPGC